MIWVHCKEIKELYWIWVMMVVLNRIYREMVVLYRRYQFPLKNIVKLNHQKCKVFHKHLKSLNQKYNKIKDY